MKKLAAVLAVVIFSFSSCGDGESDAPDVSEIKVSVTADRFEKEIFETDPAQLPSKMKELEKKYPEFLVRFGQMLNMGNPTDSAFVLNLQHFSSDPEVRKVYDDVSKAYPNLEAINAQLTEGFKYYKHYFPDKKIPQAITYVSGFNYAISVGETFVAAGLDMYMGADYRYYSLLQFPKFKMPQMRSEYVAADMLKGWVSTEFENNDKSTELLNSMIYQGKIIYVMDHLLPGVSDTIFSGFNEQQVDWLEKNEKRVWAFLVDQKLLFNTNYSENARYLNEAPFTPGMPKDSPGRSVIWTGWKIVQSYMKKHPKVTMAQLLADADSRKILNQSGYKPMK